ncbi:acyl-CoA dehydrogenase family protein [Streptomyces sp. ME19-01-6]|uniref:acyl-CoA dehydrogenase family protein n=1 Tax=Streptomyces sp. ME19-01-6 TaxID=3028686 RepID=UPI0029AD2CA1|nr:acyl-CoA dehydrogenase family protein [Streptomyces sp. ME19-01-6]MDX3229323.1 acyl-CoA dehydrogenase family protein [Streptomyces sp. ME19-01-6]
MKAVESAEHRELFALVDELAREELEPRAAQFEASGQFPEALVRLMGKQGLMSLPFPEQWGGGGQSYTVYLRVIERLAGSWLAVAESVHLQVLACHGLARFGSNELREELLPRMLSGELLAANCMSEPEAGSDLGAMSTKAVAEDGHYVISGTKAWVSHAGVADVYNVYCRTGGSALSGLSCFLVDADSTGLRPLVHERKMGVRSLPTAQIAFDGVRVPDERMIGRRNRGMLVASHVFDHGRLGISACAVGLAQAALDHAAAYAKERTQFGNPIISFQGISFLLADMATQIAAARALLYSVAGLKGQGKPISAEAAKCKLFATDTAMRVTTDAVQVLGGYGYTQDFPVERWMREAKLLQILEGTNQIQRIAIAQSL